jgi:hypothetical protein
MIGFEDRAIIISDCEIPSFNQSDIGMVNCACDVTSSRHQTHPSSILAQLPVGVLRKWLAFAVVPRITALPV